MNELVKISEVALKYGISTRALRYYEDAGLIESIRTEDYSYRSYDQKAIKRIEQILVLRKLKLSIKDIKKVFICNSLDVLLDVLGSKIQEIDDEVTLLNQLREIITTFINQLEKCDLKIDTDLNLIYEKASTVDDQHTDSEDTYTETPMGKLMEVADKLEKMPDIRIIMLPKVKMARSGNSDLEEFDKWWSSVPVEQSLFPRDFMWYNERLNCFEWLYAIPENMTDTNGYEVFDFPGGLYAVATAYDEGEEINRINKLIHKWVEESEEFEVADSTNDTEERYDMGHIITPMGVSRAQMDLFVPIVKKGDNVMYLN